jgi:hypothetical protein
MVSEEAWRTQAAAVGVKRARKFTWENAAAQTVDVYHAAMAVHQQGAGV